MNRLVAVTAVRARPGSSAIWWPRERDGPAVGRLRQQPQVILGASDVVFEWTRYPVIVRVRACALAHDLGDDFKRVGKFSHLEHGLVPQLVQPHFQGDGDSGIGQGARLVVVQLSAALHRVYEPLHRAALRFQ